MACLISLSAGFGPDTQIIVCLFHWKQANRRQLLKLKISDATVSVLMRKEASDVLTVIPPDGIVRYGIPYVGSLIKTNDPSDQLKLNSFFEYF
jgi:hypothetical protein